MNTQSLNRGDKLLHRGTHQSLTFVQRYDDERILVTDSQGNLHAEYVENLIVDHDRQFIKSVTNFFSKTWNHLLATK